jgi:YVTN family beta-propeller protein
VLAAVATALVTVVLAVTILVARDDRTPGAAPAGAVPPAANQALRINPETYQLAATVAVGPDPAAVAARGGSVWVANRGDGTVTEIDPAANRVQRTFPAGGSGPVGSGGPGMAFANGSLWVVNTEQRLVVRVPPDTDPTPIAVPMSPIALAAAQGNVWVAGRALSGGGLVARIDVATNRFVPEVPLPHPPSGLAVTRDGRTVWVTTPEDRSVRKVDTGAGSTVRPIELPEAPGQVALGDDPAWVTTGEGDAVQRINLATNEAEPIKVGNGPTGVAFGADRVWVANGQDGTVSVINPETDDVGTIHLTVSVPGPTTGEAGTGAVPFRPAAVAADERAVWVALTP